MRLYWQRQPFHIRSTQRNTAKRRTIICVVAATCVGFCASALIVKSVWKSDTSSKTLRDDPVKCKNSGVWEEQTKTCTCTLGWIGKDCSIWYDHYCYFDNGKDYRGKLSVTKSGRTCKPWTSAENQRFKLGEHGIGIHSHCRNPDGDEKGIWCYVGGETFTEYCNATKCPDALKTWLMKHANVARTSDNDSVAVQFLYGPLISGICAGVTVLLVAIAVCEYVCRRRMFRKIEKSELDDTQVTTQVTDTKKSDDIEEGNSEEEKPGTAVVIVDVDSGKKRTATRHSMKHLKDSETQTNSEIRSNGTFTPTGLSPIPPRALQKIYSVTELVGSSSRFASKYDASTMTTINPNAITAHVNHGTAVRRNGKYSAKKRRRRKRAHEPPLSSSDSEESCVVSPEESSGTSNSLSNPASVKSNTQFAKRRRRKKPRTSSSAKAHSRSSADFARLRKYALDASHFESMNSRIRNNHKTIDNFDVSNLSSFRKCNFTTINEQRNNTPQPTATKNVAVHRNELSHAKTFPDTKSYNAYKNVPFEPC